MYVFKEMPTDFSKRVLLGITGVRNDDWRSKLQSINRLGIKEAAVFVESFKKIQRDNLYRLLLKSSLKRVPFVHLRDDCDKKEIEFFIRNYKTRFFNIHEEHFVLLDRWKGYWSKLYLEMNFDGKVSRDVKVRRIGGFCIDLSHFKAAVARGSEEAWYVFSRKNRANFACNHLGGYDDAARKDKHAITSLKDFDYLETLPKWLFGDIIALEVHNSIEEQVEFKNYLEVLLNDCFGIKR